MTKYNFPKKIYQGDIIKVLGNDELKTSEIIKRLKQSDDVKGDYEKITQDGILRVLKKMMNKTGEVEGDVKRFGFWMWKITEAGIKMRDAEKEN